MRSGYFIATFDMYVNINSQGSLCVNLKVILVNIFLRGNVGPQSMVFAEAVWNQMKPPCAEWWQRRTTGQSHTFRPLSFLPARPHWANARRNRCQEDHNSLLLGELDETTRTPSYYVDEDYSARPEIQQRLTEWSSRRGSESSTPETNVYTSGATHS